jgi:putative ABC transport system permease protein
MHFLTFLLKNLFRRKVRTALTTVGVAVAVGTLVAMLGIADGFERTARESFTKRGVDLVVLTAGKTDPLSSDIDEGVGDRIRRIPGVHAVAPGLVELVEFRRGTTAQSALVNGWELDSYNFNDLHITQGRRLEPGDQRRIMLGDILARNLNKRAGESVEMQEEKFEVIGVFRSFAVTESGSAILPLAELQRLMAREHRVTGFSVILDHSTRPPVPVEEVCEVIEAMHDDRGRPLHLSAMTTEKYVDTSIHLQLTHAMAWITSAIAVIIGTIGMLNTMIMSVFERVREIGILRAIGWRKSRVIRMVLGESLLLSAAGTVLGTLGAVVLTHWLSTFSAVNGYIEGTIAPSVFLEGFLIALLVGLVGGLYPALRAAYLLPTEALRHE